jgi:hypothetical protein
MVFSAKEQRSGLFADIAREKADVDREDWRQSGERHLEREHERIRRSFGIEESRKPQPKTTKVSESIGDDINNGLEGIASEQGIRVALADAPDVVGLVLSSLGDDPAVAKALDIINNKIAEVQHACSANDVNLKRHVTTMARQRFSSDSVGTQQLFYLLVAGLR